MNLMKSGIVVSILSLLMTGCSQSTISQQNTEPPNGQSVAPIQQQQQESANKEQTGYLYSGNSAVSFIQWTEANKELIGQIQTFKLKNGQIIETKSQNGSFKGIRDGESISLAFGFGSTVTGTFKDNKLTLVIPDSDGNLDSMIFNKATVEDYNNAVAVLRDNVNKHNQNVQEQKNKEQEIAELQKAVTQANETLATALKSLQFTREDLGNFSSFEDISSDYQSLWEDITTHQNEMREAASVQPFDSNQLSKVENILYKIENDGTRFENLSSIIESRESSITEKITEVNTKIEATDIALVNLQSVSETNSSGFPAPQYTLEQVQNDIALAKKQIDASTKSLQQAKKIGNEYAKKATLLIAESQKFVAGLIAND